LRIAMILTATAKLLLCVASSAYGKDSSDISGAAGGPLFATAARSTPATEGPVYLPRLASRLSLAPPLSAADNYQPLARSDSVRTTDRFPSYPRANAFANCDDDPNQAIVGLLGYDSWRGISDDSWQNNGISVGLNYGTRLGEFSDLTGIGFQIGGSVGVFDFSGSEYRPHDRNTAQTQGFLTYGFFRKPNERSPLSAAVVEDWMFNDNFGVYAENPTLSQLRWQFGYAVNARNEFGLWGASRVMGDTRNVAGVGPTSWRPIDQLNPYWHYKWSPGGADTTLWVGVPERHRLSGNGSLGDYIAGVLATVPFSDRVSLYTLLTYMHPSARPGPAGSTEDAWNFTIALLFYPGRNARSSTVAGRCWLPQLPIANNGLFMVDTNGH
jgi:hypothetical protein